MATYAALIHELEKSCVLLQRHIPDAELAVMAQELSQTLVHVIDADLAAAFRKHRERSRFFPTEADIRDALSVVVRPALVAESGVGAQSSEQFTRYASLLCAAMRGERDASAFFSKQTPAKEKERILQKKKSV